MLAVTVATAGGAAACASATKQINEREALAFVLRPAPSPQRFF
jgi:hypothetical protein